MSENVGNILSNAHQSAIRKTIIAVGMIVYIAMIAYSFTHNYNLMVKGVPTEMLIWAVVGVSALELTALALPAALHWWTHSPLQRLAAFGFYALDLALIFFNVVLSFALTSGAFVPEWMNLYLTFIMPASPIIAGAGWSALFLLDPSQREKSMIETLRASTRDALANQIAEAAKSQDVNELVEAAGKRMAFDIVQESLGIPVNRQIIPSTAKTIQEPKVASPDEFSENGADPVAVSPNGQPAETT